MIKKTIAIVGNPNTGKSSLFNALTGGTQHVGNWPGVTVEYKEGTLFKNKDQKIILVDLPGIYSLRARAEDELVASKFLIQQKPTLSIVVLDASHLERSLYLLMQVRELGQRVVAVLNMHDLAMNRGIKINVEKLSEKLGCPVLQTTAKKRNGIEKLKNVVLAELEKDYVVPTVSLNLNNIEKQTSAIEKRWNMVAAICGEVIELTGREDVFSARVDKVATHKWLGIPLFFAVVFLMFYFTYHVAAPVVEVLEEGVQVFSDGIRHAMEIKNIHPLIQSLVVDGIIAGVGAVVVFFPNIFLLFFFLAILESSGYLSRGTFVMDRFMNWMGLHGKSFIPMIMGFGCGVPALMGTRILDQRRDRLITMLTIPFISCSARLPVFVLFAAAFFPDNAPTVIFSLYMIGIFMAISAAKIFSMTLFKKSESMLVMELPTYHIPNLKEALLSGWRRSSEFLKKAGTVILLAVVGVWGLSNLPLGVEYASDDSYIGLIGQFIAPIFEPAGYGTWQASVSLSFGFMAKEVVIGTFGTLLGGGEAGLVNSLGGLFTPLSAFSFLVMVLLYVPCVPALMVFKRESGSWKWVLFLVLYTCILGWLMSVLVYQIGQLLGFN